MSTVENPKDVSSWQRIALVRFWLLTRSRPQFHYAIDVLYQGFLYTAMMTVLIFLFNLFGLGYSVNYDLIGHFIGPLGVGALAAGYFRFRIPDSFPYRGWVVAAVYGGVAIMTFALLLDFSIVAAGAGFGIGALFFMLLHWLFELEARKARAA